MTAPFSPILRAELAKLDDAQILALLGEIVEPSQGGPICTKDDFHEELTSIRDAYSKAYKGLLCTAYGEHLDPDAAYWAEADRRHDERVRDDFSSQEIL